MAYKKILITGAKGFLGKNLHIFLQELGYDVFLVDKDTNQKMFDTYSRECDFVFHLAGVNRSNISDDYYKGNSEYTKQLIETLIKNENLVPIMFSSSIHVNQENDYGKSKRMAEKLLHEYAIASEQSVYIYRFSNIFGKWSRPNYNSVVSTFCYNIAHDIPITIHNEKSEIELIYIDDLLEEMEALLNGKVKKSLDCFSINKTYKLTIQELAGKIFSFKAIRNNNILPYTFDEFTKNLYSTYLTYLSDDAFSYPLKMNTDTRGSFTEFLRLNDLGQISINVSLPGVVKGNHWHQTKTEKFLVISGEAEIGLKHIITNEIIMIHVDDAIYRVVDIPPGYTHYIKNIGKTNLVTIIWANEMFNEKSPDTFFNTVLNDE